MSIVAPRVTTLRDFSATLDGITVNSRVAISNDIRSFFTLQELLTAYNIDVLVESYDLWWGLLLQMGVIVKEGDEYRATGNKFATNKPNPINPLKNEVYFSKEYFSELIRCVRRSNVTMRNFLS